MKADEQNVEVLSEIIATNTAKVASFLRSKNLRFPGFHVDAPSTSSIPPEEVEIGKARLEIINATRNLQSLMLGPHEFLQSFHHNELLSMQAITRFQIARSFPVHEEVTYTQISSKCGLDEPLVRRILRHAMTKNIFREPRKGTVAHTAASRLLADDAQIHDWVGASTDDLWQGAAQTVNAILKYPHSQEPNHTGFALANGTNKSIFEIFAQNPDRARRFGSAMAAYVTGTGYDLDHLSKGFDWKALGYGKVVDVGGSTGFVSIHLASAFPLLHFTVQDLAGALGDSAAKVPPALKDRLDFQAHDFFTEQPVCGADVYLFRWIFHNWSDLYCLRILRNLVPALKKGALVLIMDNVLPEPGSLGQWQEELVRAMDLTMLEIQNSRERDLDDWAALFREADSRFEFLGGEQPAGSRLWILSARWNGS